LSFVCLSASFCLSWFLLTCICHFLPLSNGKNVSGAVSEYFHSSRFFPDTFSKIN
jgi:hypothetical protein